MNKPDWKDAPEWANYLAMDADGDWYWHESEPEARYEEAWYNPHKMIRAGHSTGGWQDTLEARP